MMPVIRIVLITVLLTIVESTWWGRRRGWSARKDPCENYYCANGGTCVSQSYYGYSRYQATPTCQCIGSWQGERCADDPCDSFDCNSGTCYANKTGSPLCCCPEGCTGETCADDDNTSCEAANGMCVADDGTCNADRVLDIPCCNGKLCCRNDPCDSFDCNSGTCYANKTGSPLCCCPEGCTGDTCSDDDNTSCEAANGMCVADDGTCAANRILDIPCCNGKVCCQDDPCDGIDCNNGTCDTTDSGLTLCRCPLGCTGDTCAQDDHSECKTIEGWCVDEVSCGRRPQLGKACCNGNVCCPYSRRIVCEDTQDILLTCGIGSFFKILDVNYGREDYLTCYEADRNLNVTCYTPTALSILKAECDGKPTCLLKANSATFGDPCPGIYKYLRVWYLCVN